VRHPATHDEEYVTVVDRERPVIQATAYLLTGDPVRAERLAQLVFAQLYGRLPTVQHPRVEALQSLVRAARGPVRLPWEHRMRFELMDGPSPMHAAAPIITDLGRLSYERRVAIVMDGYAGLSSGQIAEILQRPVGTVLQLVQQARAALAVGHRERASDQALAQQFNAAIPYDLLKSSESTDDLAHGRQLIRRRWLLRGSAALAAVLLIVLAAGIFLPTRRPVQPVGSVPQVQSSSSVPISTPLANCDPASTPACRSTILFKWRSDMAEVASSHLDPSGEYFSGFGYYYNNRYDTASFWSGQGGALGLQMFRLDRGATELYLQVATSRKFAIRCGTTTGQQCLRFQFMDGNSYLMTDSTLRRRGIEVQYSPSGQEVVTVIARNTQRGQILEISRGDLIKLVQDERLHLPKR
jgi:DNA-directed RNA polymerase specialized sigma24 family protein